MDIHKATMMVEEIKQEYATMDGLKEYVEAIDFVLKSLEQAERSSKIKEGYLELIHGLSFDYDGCNTVKSLKELIDELDGLAIKGLKNDDKSMMYMSAVDFKKGIIKGKNVLFEEVEDEEVENDEES